MDPFLEMIQLLRPRATVWSGIDGVGRWGVAFHKRDDVLFCWMQRGECLLTRPGMETVRLGAGDFVLVRTVMPFVLTSDPDVVPVDSEKTFGPQLGAVLRLGEGEGAAVGLRGGRFFFDSANEGLLTGLLPPLVHVRADDVGASRVGALLAMNDAECAQPGPGSEFIIARLMELILVEVLRGRAGLAEEETGLLAGLSDPVTARALRAMHAEVARGWTVDGLARLCGVSRSSLAMRFQRVVGVGPIEYLLGWRIALAKDELRRGGRGIGEIALAVGFQSASAFSTSFKRVVGVAPREFVEG